MSNAIIDGIRPQDFASTLPTLSVDSDVNPAKPYVTYVVDASLNNVTITLPDITVGDSRYYRIALNENSNHCNITTAGGTQLIDGKTEIEITTTKSSVTLKSNGIDGYILINDTRPYYRNIEVTTNLDLSDGYDSMGVYFCNPPASTEIVITLPDSTPAHEGMFAKFILGNDVGGSVRLKTASGENIGNQPEPTITVPSSGFEIQDTGSKYIIPQDSRPKAQTASLTLYATPQASDVGGYFLALTSTGDARYSPTSVDVNVGLVTTSAQLLAVFASEEGVAQGLIPETQLLGYAQIRKAIGSGSGVANFYVEIYKRESDTTETLLTTSNITSNVTNSTFEEFNLSSIFPSTTFASDDRLLVKLYANRVAGGSDPTYEMRTQGETPARVLISIPSTSISHDSVAGVNDAGNGVLKGHINNIAQDLYGKKTFKEAIIEVPETSVTLDNNGELQFEATDNSTITVKYRGSDGVTRSGTINLT